MPRAATFNAINTLFQKNGNHPILIVGINWGLSVSWYSSQTLEVDPVVNCQPALMNVGSISCQKRSDNLGNSSSASVTLVDTDGFIKFALDNTAAEKKPCAIYQHFQGNSTTDMILLIYGRLTGPIEWNEGTREVTFNVTSEMESEELGFSPTKNDFTDLSPDAYGVPWPLIFGTVKHVPAVQVRKHMEGVLASGIQLSSKGFINQKTSTGEITVMDRAVKVIETDTGIQDEILLIEGDFPVGEQFEIIIDGVVFKGRYTTLPEGGGTFKVESANEPLYINVKLAARDANDINEQLRLKAKKGTIDEQSGYNMLWIDDPTINLVNKNCYFKTAAGKEWYNYCIEQVGKRCKFREPFRSPVTGQLFLMTAAQLITEVRTIELNGMISGIGTELKPAEMHPKQQGKYRAAGFHLAQQGSSFWSRVSGTPVRLWRKEDPDVYVFSAVQCDRLDEVWGRKKINLEQGKDVLVLTKIPTDYYEVQLQSNFQVHGAFASGLVFKIPLTDREEKSWDGSVFVSARSTVGPNTADIIKYLVKTYSHYQTDGTFNGVAAKIDDTPSHFALFERGDVIEVCRDIAWQARCALVVENQQVSMAYLPDPAFPTLVVDETLIESKTLKFGQTEINQVVTKLIGTWTPDYRDEPKPTRHHERQTGRLREIIRALTNDTRATKNQTQLSIYENNIDKYGLRPSEKRIFIYTKEEYVDKTVDFWGRRLSNIWRLATFNGMPPTLMFREFDAAGITLANGMISPMTGMIESISVNPDLSINIVMWLPALAGTNVQSSLAYG